MGQPGTGTGGFAVPSNSGGGSGGFSAPAAPTDGSGGFSQGRGGTGDGGFGTGTVKTVQMGAPAKSGGGGLFGSLAHDITGAAHFVSTRLATGGNTLKSIGTGLYGDAKVGLYEPWKNFFTTGHPYSHNAGAAIDKSTNQFLAGTIEGPVGAVKDISSGRFRDPIGDFVQLLPAAHGLARVGLGASDAAGALRAGEGAGAAAKAFRNPSLLSTPRMLNEPGRQPVSLYSSHNAARRIVQAGIDRTVNKALANDRANGFLGREGPVARYGRNRMSGTVAERARVGIRYRQALISTTRAAGRSVERFAKSIVGHVEDPQLTAQALLHSLHDNTPPEYEAILHELKARQGVNPEENMAWAKAFSDAAKLGVVHLTEDNRLAVDESHPLAAPLATADSALEKLGAYAENEIVARGLREPSALEDRKARVNQLVQRSEPLLGAEPQALRDARRQVANLQTKLETANERERVHMQKQAGRIADVQQRVGGRSVELGSPHRERIVTLGHQLEAAQQRVQSLEDRYGLSSPDRRVAMQQGIHAREQMTEAAHRLFGDEAAHHLAQIESFARQYARTHDVTPHEFYAQFLRNTETPLTIDKLPEEIAPLYEAAEALPHEPLPEVSGSDIVSRVLRHGDVRLPKGLTPELFAENIDNVMALVREGAPYRDWHARGAAVIRDAAKRLGVPVKRMIDLIAVTSQGANPTFNLRLAVKAAKEYQATGKVTNEPFAPMVEAQMKLTGSKKAAKGYSGYLHKPEEAQASLEGKKIETIKRTSYRGNFLHEIDPKAFAKEYGARLDPVTVDRHIARMFGFGSSPSPEQYALVERVFQEIAKDLGWKAKEVQAAAWVPWKARNEMGTALARATKAGRGEQFDTSLERFMPNAADAYEAGHAENIGVLYHSAPAVQHVLDANAGHDLQGLPATVKVNGEPIQWHSYGPAQQIAESYMREAGLPYEPPQTYAHVDPARAARIAQWYDEAIHAHDDPRVAAAYGAMARETLAQYEAITRAGYRFEFYPEGRDPYPGGPREAILDLVNNKHMYVFPTEGGFGTESVTTEHPLLADSGVRWNGQRVTHNDVFRAVHDFFGHAKEGVGFRADGEENAWRSHSAMYTPEARAAMTAETRGQNSWVNYGPHGEANRTASQVDTVYADQKAVVAPDWVVHDGAGDTLHSESGQRILGSYEPDTATMKLSAQHAIPETMLHEALHAVRRSLAPVVQEIARRMYAPNGWDRAAEEHFVSDMMRVSRGETVSPEVQRLFTMTHQYVPGRGYIPMTVWEDARQSHSPLAAVGSDIAGSPKSPINSHFATGEATAQGMRRTDVAESVVAHVQKFFRYFNTLDHRELSVSYGGKHRLSSDDILMRYDMRTPAGMKLPASRVGETLKEALGILENKTKLPAPEQEGMAAGVLEAMRDVAGHLFPRLGSDEELRRIDETADVGTEAPDGYVWVPRQIARLKDLEGALSRGEPTKIGRFADNINGAITAATVYMKIGHLSTRVFTNAATNIMQGSAAPWEIARSVALSRELTPDEMTEALAYAGTHYFEAAPGATGSTVVAKGVAKGLHVPFTDKVLRTKSGEAVMSPQWWAHHVDAPFRFNSIAYEARKAGYDGTEGFRQFLQDVREYNSLEPDARARVDGVLRRAGREAIAYDRLNQFERKYLTRIIWFYPWIKGSTVFTGNTLLEHPFKAAALYQAGAQGNQEERQQLGDMPSYAQGLTPLTGGAEPVVADFNTFNPSSTAGDLMQIPEHLRNIAGLANPVYGSGLNIAEGVNPYGAGTPTPIQDNLQGLLSSTPEYQIGRAATDHGDQSHRLYPGGHGLDPLYKNWLGELVRALGGPATPRHVNPLAGHSLAQRERTGR